MANLPETCPLPSHLIFPTLGHMLGSQISTKLIILMLAQINLSLLLGLAPRNMPNTREMDC